MQLDTEIRSEYTVTWEIVFLKNHIQNVVEKLVQDPLKKVKIDHISGSTVWNYIRFVFIVGPTRDLPKDVKTKVLSTCFDLI